ncbi:MAG: hypothetical protein KBT02_10165 [Treponema sp.]|nr:hypothetical protein [Candidatus Treponema caballi]
MSHVILYGLYGLDSSITVGQLRAQEYENGYLITRRQMLHCAARAARLYPEESAKRPIVFYADKPVYATTSNRYNAAIFRQLTIERRQAK